MSITGTVTSRDVNFSCQTGYAGAAYSQFVHITKKFLPFMPEFSAAFYAPQEFSGDVPEK